MNQGQTSDISNLFRIHDQVFNTYLISKATGEIRKRAVKYLCDRMAYPDSGSDFAKNFGNLSHIFDPKEPLRYKHANWFLHVVHYVYNMDAIMLVPANQQEDEMKVLGYNAFSIRGLRWFSKRSIHVFSTEVIPSLYGQRLGAYLNLKTVDYAKTLGIEDFRLGKGRNARAEAEIDTMIQAQEHFGVRITRRGKGWLKLEFNTGRESSVPYSAK
jgi:hypothetical protein